jgi:hypothetical protein
MSANLGNYRNDLRPLSRLCLGTRRVVVIHKALELSNEESYGILLATFLDGSTVSVMAADSAELLQLPRALL